MSNLRTLSDDELLRHAYASHDSLTTTDLELEVASRLQARVDEAAALEPVNKLMDDADMEPADLAALLKLLDEFSASDLKSLREKLERSDKWFAIAEEAGDLFQQLQDLTNATV